MIKNRRILFTALKFLGAGCLLFMSPSVLFANNGLTMTSYGARSAGMGGATLAVGGSAMDLQSNPANLSRIKNGIFEAGSSFLAPSLTYEDAFIGPNEKSTYTNHVNSEPGVFPLPYVGYIAPINDHSGWGVAFYAQGGMGAEFNGIVRNTPGYASLDSQIQRLAEDPSIKLPMIGEGNLIKENTYSNLGFAKLTTGYAIRIGKLNLGVGLDFGAGQLEWRWTFSDPTGSMELPGAGYRYKSDRAYSFSGKAGLTYDINERWSIAYSYIAESRLRFDGDMSINQGDIKNYPGNAQVSTRLSFPEEHFGGVAYKNGGFTLGITAGYLKWSNVMRTKKFELNRLWVTNPFGVTTNDLTFHMNWRDQPVYAIGFEYRPDRWAFRMGANYAPGATGSDGVNPLFPAISDRHAMVGVGYQTDSRLEIDFALEYAFPVTVKGSMMSDWTVMHAFGGLSQEGFRNPYYTYSVSMRQVIPHIGVKSNF